LAEVAHRFEDLVAWQRARELARFVYEVTSSSRFADDLAQARQMRRAAVSVMANVAEGFERRGPREFSRFLLIARASCAEVKSHFYVAADVGLITDSQFRVGLQLAVRASQVISRLHTAVSRQGAIPHVGPPKANKGTP